MKLKLKKNYFLEYYSRENCSKNINVRYLEYTKNIIYNKFVTTNNKITYKKMNKS